MLFSLSKYLNEGGRWAPPGGRWQTHQWPPCGANCTGWEIPKFRPEHFTNDYGFISDYLAEFIRELRKEQYGDAIDHYFRLGKNLNQRDTIAVRRMVDGYLKLVYPDGEFTKEELEEVLKLSLEMRRR